MNMIEVHCTGRKSTSTIHTRDILDIIEKLLAFFLVLLDVPFPYSSRVLGLSKDPKAAPVVHNILER